MTREHCCCFTECSWFVIILRMSYIVWFCLKKCKLLHQIVLFQINRINIVAIIVIVSLVTGGAYCRILPQELSDRNDAVAALSEHIITRRQSGKLKSILRSNILWFFYCISLYLGDPSSANPGNQYNPYTYAPTPTPTQIPIFAFNPIIFAKK